MHNLRSQYFKIQELVPVDMYNKLSEDLLWSMFNHRTISSLDAVKDKFPKGTMIINSYMWGGDRGWSGIRTKDSKYYSERSMHSKAKAFDAVFNRYDVEDVRQYILENQGEFPFIGGIELGVSWLHFDSRPRRNGKIITFNA